MSKKKEKLLQKYLEKKKKQRKRNDILAQIAEIEQKRQKVVEKNDEEKILENIEQEVESEEVECIEECDLIGKDKIEVSMKQDKLLCKEEEPIYNLIETNTNEIQLEDSSTSSCDSNFIDEPDTIYKDIYKSCLEVGEQRKLLPIYYEQQEIIHKLRHNALIFITGETGCGKSTQIPQFIYKGLYTGKRIGVTQPRRMGAINISERINKEMNTKVAGYHIRYNNTITKSTIIKIMTDGILLKEIQKDFLLSKYSVIVLDEVHERSVNLDILIPLLSKVLRLRKDFKLVLMSASNMESIKEYFIEQKELCSNKLKDQRQVCDFQIIPTIVNVPSNTHKVKIFYESKEPKDYIKGVEDRIHRILRADKTGYTSSILVFLPSISDIYILINILNLDNCVVLPLHSKLSKDEQRDVYKEYDDRKIILSTNISETTITISDIHYVIDTGLVKKKYVDNTGMTSYSVDYISKSSAQQRAGRAGRTGPGVCYRLYSGLTYNNFDNTDTPKIFYEPLERVILDLLSLGIRDVHKFPFLSRPPEDNLNCALKELRRLNVIDNNMELTKLGRCIINLPCTPRTSKLLCIPNTTKILPELIDIVCILSCELDIRRNNETKEHFIGEKSDLIVALKIYRKYMKEDKKAFTKRIGVGGTILKEVDNMSRDLKKKFGVIEENILDLDIKDQIRNALIQVYKDRICTVYDDSYWYRNNKLYVSNNSVDADGERVVFESLVKGRHRIYMKNILILETQK